jgi:hypothetical protein
VSAVDLIGPILASMLGCADSALDPAPGRALVVPGLLPAWDSCCDGQVWVRLMSLTADLAGGQPSQRPPLMWRATIGCGVLRCAAVVDDQGHAPPAEVLTAEALALSADRAALEAAIQCEMPGVSNVMRIELIRWDPVGPEGGCAGGEWQFQTLVDNCRCG